MAALLAAVAPLFLWPIELFFPYPYVVEEMAKAVILWFAPTRKNLTLLFCGLLFAFSESVLYIFNMIPPVVLAQRLILTTFLHTGTFWLIARNRWLGLTLAIIIHYLFNVIVPKT